MWASGNRRLTILGFFTWATFLLVLTGCPNRPVEPTGDTEVGRIVQIGIEEMARQTGNTKRERLSVDATLNGNLWSLVIDEHPDKTGGGNYRLTIDRDGAIRSFSYHE